MEDKKSGGALPAAQVAAKGLDDTGSSSATAQLDDLRAGRPFAKGGDTFGIAGKRTVRSQHCESFMAPR